MNNLSSRLERLEEARPTAPTGRYLTFSVQCPCDLPVGADVEFLRRCGHVILAGDFVFVRRLRGMSNRGVHDLPLRDVTGHLVTEAFRETAPPAPVLDRVPQSLRFTLRLGV
ncbi:hypothetical protein [Methylobacterium sp. JK268]